MIKIGVLSDTHLYQLTDEYNQLCQQAFTDCHAIIHAGDLTSLSALQPFTKKEVFAVCGNMCGHDAQERLPHKKRVTIEGVTIGISHGAGSRANIEDRVFNMFPDVDCIVYGHTHIAVCHNNYGKILMMNPGSFQMTSRHGGAGSYGILTIEDGKISGRIHSIADL